MCWSPPPTPIDPATRTEIAGKRLARWSWRVRRVMRGYVDDATCACVPAYTGGLGRPVMVDGKLRTPACFGSRGEPWAQPLGLGRMIIPDHEPVVVVHDPRRHYSILVELWA